MEDEDADVSQAADLDLFWTRWLESLVVSTAEGLTPPPHLCGSLPHLHSLIPPLITSATFLLSSSSFTQSSSLYASYASHDASVRWNGVGVKTPLVLNISRWLTCVLLCPESPSAWAGADIMFSHNATPSKIWWRAARTNQIWISESEKTDFVLILLGFLKFTTFRMNVDLFLIKKMYFLFWSCLFSILVIWILYIYWVNYVSVLERRFFCYEQQMLIC